MYTYALCKFKTVKMHSFKATKIGKVQIYSHQLFKRTTNQKSHLQCKYHNGLYLSKNNQ